MWRSQITGASFDGNKIERRIPAYQQVGEPVQADGHVRCHAKQTWRGVHFASTAHSPPMADLLSKRVNGDCGRDHPRRPGTSRQKIGKSVAVDAVLPPRSVGQMWVRVHVQHGRDDC